MELHGVTGSPYKHPVTRQKIPAPFSRPRIDAGGAPVKRTWKDTSVLDIKRGDTVANFGTVEEATEFSQVGEGKLWFVRLINVLGESRDFGGHERLYTFGPDTDG